MLENLPPFVQEAEQAVLGQAIWQGQAERILTELRLDDFVVGAHRRLFEVIQKVAGQGAVDLVTVCAELHGDDLDHVGGASYLMQVLLEAGYWCSSVTQAIRLVQTAALQRQVIVQADALMKAAYARAEPTKLLEQTEALGASVQERLGTEAVTSAETLSETLGSTQWVWRPWLPVGFVTLLAGETGMGKSTLALLTAGAYTGLFRWPDGSDPLAHGRKVLWVDCEGTQPLLIENLRRFEMGSVMSQFILPGVAGNEDIRLDDRGTIERVGAMATEQGAGHVVLDSLSGAFSGDENSSEIRWLLRAIAEVARERQQSWLLIHHLRKANQFETSAVTLDRLRGSSAIGQFSRTIWAIDRPDPQSETRRLSMIKSNLARLPEPLGFALAEDGVRYCEAPEAPGRQMRGVEKATEFLRIALKTAPRLAEDLLREAELEGISELAIFQAADKMGLNRTKRRLNERLQTWWSLPF